MTRWVPATFVLVVACPTEPKVTSTTKEVKLTNVSYDPTRELYTDVNAAFSSLPGKARPVRR